MVMWCALQIVHVLLCNLDVFRRHWIFFFVCQSKALSYLWKCRKSHHIYSYHQPTISNEQLCSRCLLSFGARGPSSHTLIRPTMCTKTNARWQQPSRRAKQKKRGISTQPRNLIQVAITKHRQLMLKGLGREYPFFTSLYGKSQNRIRI